MIRTFSDGHPKVLPACNFLSQYYFYNIFLQKSCRFSLQTLTKFEAAKTGSGVGFLRLTAVCSSIGFLSVIFIFLPFVYNDSVSLDTYEVFVFSHRCLHFQCLSCLLAPYLYLQKTHHNNLYAAFFIDNRL